MYMAAACPDAIVYTMEGCPAISEIADENFNEAGLKNIKLITGSFDDIIPEIINNRYQTRTCFYRRKSQERTSN